MIGNVHMSSFRLFQIESGGKIRTGVRIRKFWFLCRGTVWCAVAHLRCQRADGTTPLFLHAVVHFLAQGAVMPWRVFLRRAQVTDFQIVLIISFDP